VEIAWDWLRRGLDHLKEWSQSRATPPRDLQVGGAELPFHKLRQGSVWLSRIRFPRALSSSCCRGRGSRAPAGEPAAGIRATASGAREAGRRSAWRTPHGRTCVSWWPMGGCLGWTVELAGARDRCPEVPVLYCRRTPRDIFHRGESSPSVPFLQKPFAPEVFVKTLRSCSSDGLRSQGLFHRVGSVAARNSTTSANVQNPPCPSSSDCVPSRRPRRA